VQDICSSSIRIKIDPKKLPAFIREANECSEQMLFLSAAVSCSRMNSTKLWRSSKKTRNAGYNFPRGRIAVLLKADAILFSFCSSAGAIGYLMAIK